MNSAAAVIKGIDTQEVEKEAREIAGWFHGVFKDRYFIEVMNNGVEIQRLQLENAVEMANRMGLPLVATSDCHYVDPTDAEAQDIMLYQYGSLPNGYIKNENGERSVLPSQSGTDVRKVPRA